MRLTRTHIVTAGSAVALSSVVAVPALTSAQSAPGTTITVQEKVRTVVSDDVAPKSKTGRVSVGDRLITRQSLFGPGKKPTGTLFTECTGVGPTKGFSAATLLCTVTYKFAKGQIVASGVFKLDDNSARVPIVGGSGAYAGAQGTVRSSRPAKGFDSADIITITR